MNLRCFNISKSLTKSLIQIHHLIHRRNIVKLAYKCCGTPDYTAFKSGQVPVILLHDFLGSKKNWEFNITEELAACSGRPVVALDARNHGESPHESVHDYYYMARDVNAFINSNVDTKEAMLIGHGMGGKTAMYLALAQPGKIRNLVIIDQSPLSKEAADRKKCYLRLLDAMKCVKFGSKDIDGGRSEAKYWLNKADVITDERTMNFILTNVGEKPDKSIGWLCNLDVFIKHLDDIMGFPFDIVGKQYQGACMFIAGTESNEIESVAPQLFVESSPVPLCQIVVPSEEDLSGIKDFFPEATLNFIEGAGHNPHVDFPETFVELVCGFFKQHPV